MNIFPFESMNLCSLFAKSLLFLAGSALISLGKDFTLQTSGTIFLPGVSADSGWVSVKKHNITDYKYDDSAMCSAASAASVMAWWRNTKEGAAMTGDEMYEMYDKNVFLHQLDNDDGSEHMDFLLPGHL